MSAYDDLIPGTSPTRRRSAYDDLLPGGAPAAPVQPAEDARPAGDEAVTVPRVADVARSISEEILAQQPARATMTRRGGVRILPPDPNQSSVYADAADNVYELPGAEWSEVGRSIIPAAGAQIRNAVTNLRRMANEDSIQGREMVLRSPADPESPQEVAYGPILRRARARHQEMLEQELAARPGIEQDAAAAREDLAAVTPKDMSTVQQAVFSAGSSAPTTLAGLAAGILTRSPAVGMAIAGGGGATVQAGSTYGEAREKGATHDMAKLAAAGDAAIEGLDALPVGVALKRGSAFAKRVLKTAGVEATTEGGQQLLQDLRSMAMENPDLTLGELWQGFKVAVLAGAMGGSVYGTVGAAANAGRKEADQMHSEAEGAPAEPVAEPSVEPVVAPAESKPAAPSPYADLIPGGADLDGRVEPTMQVAPAAPAAQAPRTPEPWEQPQEQVTEPLTIENPDVRSTLENMAKHEAGWAEVGGRLIRRKRSEVAGDEEISRTQWIPKSDWWRGRPGGLNEAQTQDAVRKALAGEKLNKREQQAIDFMVEVANQRIVERRAITDEEWSGIGSDIQAEGLEPTHQNAIDSDLVAQAVAIDEGAVETAAVQYENDDAAFMAEIRRIVHGQEVENAEAAGGREADRGPAQGAAPGFQLEQQTEAELAARARAQAEAEARRIAEEQAAERKRTADAQVGDFILTGSERAADADPGQGRLSFGMPAHTITVGTVPAAAAGGARPPARAQASVGKQQARPDAIREAMRELFGAPINEKHQGSKNLGIYRIKPETIRLRNRNDLRTAAHEVGHHISNRNKAFRAVMKQHATELISIMPEAYKQQVRAGKPMSKKLQIEEGFAEFIAEYLTAPAQLRAKVPGFYAAFETWLAQNPTYAKALERVAGMLEAHQRLGAEEKILAKVGAFQPTLGQRAATLVSKDTWDTFAQATLDKWHPLKAMVADLAPGLAASKNPYLAARLLAGDAAIIEDWISDFTTPFDYAKRLDGKNYGMPLKKILEPILQGGEVEINKFKAYLIARRAAELKRAGKENLFTAEEIAAGLKLETGQPGRARLFEATANLIYDYNDRLVQYAVEGGLLSPETAKAFKQYANYIPFFREPEGDAKGGGRGDPFKRLMGGTANLRDPFANLIQNTANIIHATNRNAMLQKAVALAKEVPGGGRWIETVPLPQQAHNIATKRIVEQLEQQGVKVDTSMAEDMAAMQTFFMPSGRADERTRTIVYKQGGELKAAQVNDPLLWKTLGNIPPLQMGLIGKMLAFPAQTLRAGVVLDPTFMVRNFVRDTLSATVQSKGAFIPVASTAQGIKMMAQQKDAYRLWRSFGGAFSDQFREPEEAARIIERMAKRGGFAPSSIVTPTRWLEALRRVGSFTESGSRIGEFAATYKPGDIDSALQAALNAREVSTDFGMRGGSEAIQVLTRITPFMNPAMQGMYKTARVLTGADGKGAAAKAAILGVNMALVSIALALMNSDEDWYQRIEEWEKTTYWHFKAGDNVYRIPKPFEYGTLFASMPEAVALRAAGQEGGEDFKKRMLQALGFVFGFRVIPQVATLMAEPWANKSFFTGRQIVPDRQDRLEPGLQANPNTSKVAQVAGEAANVSPAMIDNVVRNMFGTVGVHVTTAADLLLEGTGAFPAGRERGWQTWPALKAFVRDPDNPNTKQQRDFYEALEKYRRAVNSVKEMRNRGDDTKADAYAERKADELTSAKNAEAAARRLAKLRKSIRSIEWSRDMSPSEKREEINALNAEMQAVVEDHTPLYQAARKSYSRSATEGGR